MRLARGTQLVLASHNPGKLREYAELLAPYGLELAIAGDLGLNAPAETEATLEANALLKARSAVLGAGLPALADDSGLEIPALGNRPGARSADWAEGPNGRNYKHAFLRIAELLGAVPPPHAARFRTVIALAMPGGGTRIFAGTVEGRLAFPPRGESGFGYDPIFVPEGGNRTFGEMTRDEKSRESHRSRALARFASQCLER